METLKIFKDDSKGVALSLDLLLALIPLTLVLGLVAANMGNIMYETQDTIYRSSLERAAADTTNTLLKTSGDPYNWETDPSHVKVVGLARTDPTNNLSMEYVISSQKLGRLNTTGPQAVQNIIGDSYGFSIVITSIKSPQQVLWKMSSANGTTQENAKDVVTVQRDVVYGGFDIVSSIEGATHDHGKPQYWPSDEPFSTNADYLEIYDYYILVIDRGVTSASIGINTYEVVTESQFKGYNKNSNWTVPISPDFLKDGIDMETNDFWADKVASGGDMDVYVVQVPKGTPQDQVTLENARGQKYLFQLYAWTK